MKLSVLVTGVMIIAVVLAVAAVGFFSFTVTKDALIEQIGREQQELANEALALIDRTLYQKYQEIQVIADANPIQDLFTSDEYLGRARQRLGEFELQTGPWDSLEIFTTEGISILHPEVSNHDPIEKRALAESLQGKVFVSDLYFSEEINRVTMLFSAPIRQDDPGSAIDGVIIGKFSWPVILETIDELERVEGRHVHLFNKDGMTIATPTADKDEILQYDLQQIPLVQQALQGECSSSSFLLEDPHEEGDEHAQHIPSLSSCSLQQGYLGFTSKGWGLLIETPQDAILQPVQRLTQRFFTIGFLIVLLFIPLSFLLSRTITKPLSVLTQSNKDIIAGKFEKAQQQQQQQQRYSMADEIKELLDTRKVMLTSIVGKKDLEKSQKELKKKVEELEKWEKLTTGRELRIAELKKRVKELEGKK